MSWCQHSHVRIKNKVIQETYIRHGCFEVITFYWLQSENVVWLANLTLGFGITLLPLCSNQWEPFSHELLLICIPQSNINSFPEVFQFHYRYFFFSEISAVSRFTYTLTSTRLFSNSFMVAAQNKYRCSPSSRKKGSSLTKVILWTVKLYYEQFNQYNTFSFLSTKLLKISNKKAKRAHIDTSICTKN